MVEPGSIGVVISNHAGMDADPRLCDEETGEMLPPTDGWSIVKFAGPANTNKAAIAHDSLDCYRLVAKTPGRPDRSFAPPTWEDDDNRFAGLSSSGTDIFGRSGW